MTVVITVWKVLNRPKRELLEKYEKIFNDTFVNCLLIYPEEIKDNIATISGARFSYIISRHDLKESGITIRGGVVGGKIGEIKVLSINKNSIELELNCNQEPPARKDSTLIVALPRPQAQKRIIQASAISGIKNLFFIRSEKVEKSYFQSKVLLPENIRQNVLEGLEQAVDCISPNVAIFSKFTDFTLFYDSENFNFQEKILFCSKGSKNFSQGIASQESEISKAFAIGSELGWNDHERKQFKNRGFEIRSLGDRVYRTELVAQFCMLS